MKVLAAFLALAAAGWTADRTPGPEWSDGLDAALKKAGEKNRLVLLRQVHCDCEGTTCGTLELARRPAYLERASTRKLVEDGFVPATAHAPENRDVPGLFHPPSIPAGFRRNLGAARTLIVTPTGHVLHRLDLCPHSGEVDAELAFAQKVRTECFTETWAPVPAWEERLRRLHALHALKPETWHSIPEAAAPGMAPWSGYAQLDLAWQPDLATAKELAKKTDRLVLYFQVVGNLDKEGC